MTPTTPIELAEVVGYSLCVWPPHDTPFNVPRNLDVFETVEEARKLRDEINRHGGTQVAIVEVRRVVVE